MKERYQRFCAELAQLSSQYKSRHGAIIVRGGKTLSGGWNKAKYTRTVIKAKTIQVPQGDCIVSKQSDWTRHAEIDAIRNFPNPEDLKGCDLYVSRIKKNGKSGLSAPCPLCMAEIRSVGIKRVFFSTEEEGVWACIKIS